MSVNQNQVEMYLQAVHYLLNQNANLTPPSGFEQQVLACRGMATNDVTGLVSTVIEFVEDAVSEVKFRIETDNPNLTKILNSWLSSINEKDSKYIETGFTAFVKQYVREKFLSSFNIVKYKFNKFSVLRLPTTLYLEDSSKVIALEGSTGLKQRYSLDGDNEIQNAFIRKDGAWYETFPVPFLIRRGVWANYTLKKKIKDETADVLKKLLWYLFLFKKGNPSTTGYKAPDYEAIGDDLENVLQGAKNSVATGKTPSYLGDLDTEAEHVMPDLTKILNTTIYSQIDKDILAGLGLVDIVQSIGSTRREAILNPKPLVQKTKSMILEIEALLYDMLKEVVKINKPIHPKYFKNLTKIRIIKTPLKAFWTQDFREFVRSLYDRGLLSYATTLESYGFDLETEVARRGNESKDGLEILLYPPVTQNREGTGEDATDPNIEEEEKITPDKKGIEKENFKSTSLEDSKYKKVTDLPPRVKDHMTKDLAKTFMLVVNKALEDNSDKTGKELDAIAFKKAWKVIKKIAKKGKNGKWRPVKRPVKATKDVEVQDAYNLFDEMMDIKKLELAEKKSQLLDEFLKKQKD